jgi:P27 family predicted phage terminase small subunit
MSGKPGKSGRRPIDPVLNELRGNPGKRKKPRLADIASANAIVSCGAPPMPEMIAQDPVARAEWLDIVPELLAVNVLFPVDRQLLQMYCAHYSLWVAAKKEIEKRGVFVDEPIVDRNGNVVGSRRRRNPAVAMMKEQQRICNSLLLEYGLSFAARRRMGIDAPSAQKEVDQMDAYLSAKLN